MWSAVNRRKKVTAAMRVLQHYARSKVARLNFSLRRRSVQSLQAVMQRVKRRRVHAACIAGACRLKAAVLRTDKAKHYSLLLLRVIEKEREAEQLRKEEEQRKRLEEEERVRAEIMAQEKHKIEAQADELCDEVLMSIKSRQLDMATQQLELAADCYQQVGRTDKEVIIKQLTLEIRKAEDREVSRREGEAEMVKAQELLDKGETGAAKSAAQSAKAHFERALASDMSDQVHKLMQRVQQVDDKEQYLVDAQAAEEEAMAQLTAKNFSGAMRALDNAKSAYKRAGLSAVPSLDLVEEQMMTAKRAMEADEHAKMLEEEELKKMSDLEQKAAEEQAKAMEKEVLERERDARERAKAKTEEEQRTMDSCMAVAVGGYGHERPASSDMREVMSPNSERLLPKLGRDPVTLEPDQPLEVLKEGWLLKQSKKLKKWQKRYFVLDNVALYYCRSPTSVPDGFFAIRRCQFHYSEKTCCFDVITPSRVFRMQTPDGLQQLREWAENYKKAMSARDFPYFHVEQTTRLDLSRELLLGVMSTGLRMVKLGLYDPGFEEEIAFYTFDEIYSWGASDLQTFEFRVASERMPYSFKTMHAQEIESKLEAKFTRWRDWRLYQQQVQQQGQPTGVSPSPHRVIGAHRGRFVGPTTGGAGN